MDLQRIFDEKFSGLERKHEGRFSVAAKGLSFEAFYERGGDRVLPTASVYKLCVLCELFRQAESGVIDLDALITWRPEFYCGGDGVLRAMSPGQRLSVRNMAALMIIVSDNIAAETLLDLCGAERVTRTMREWGLQDTRIPPSRYEDGAGAESSDEPMSTARDLCSLVTRIYRKDLLTGESCGEIMRILRAQRCNDMLARFIPVGEDWGEAEDWIANKTGYGTCRVEAGIVKKGDLVFSLAMFFKPLRRTPVVFKSLADYPPVLAMAEGCRAVYESFLDV